MLNFLFVHLNVVAGALADVQLQCVACGLPQAGTHSTHSHCPHTDPIDHRVLTSIGTKPCRLLYQLEPTADLLLALLVRICQLRRGGNVSVDLSLFAFTS